MRPMLGVALWCLLLLLPSTALPRKSHGRRGLSPSEELERAFLKELRHGEEQRHEEEESVYEGPKSNFVALKSKATAATHFVLKHDNLGGDSHGAKCQQLNPEEEKISPDLGLDSSLHPWPAGMLEGPVYTVKMGERSSLGQSHLEIVGVLTSYESDFLKAVRRFRWDEGHLETFGICPSGEAHAALLSLKHLHAHLADPGENRFLVLHLEEGSFSREFSLCGASKLLVSLPSLHVQQWLAEELDFVDLPVENSVLDWIRASLRELNSAVPGQQCPKRQSGLVKQKDLDSVLGVTEFQTGQRVQQVKWGAETKLRFTLPFQEDVGRSLGKLQFALLVFYPGRRNRKGCKARKRLLAAGEGLSQKQALCLSRDTHYLLLGASVTSANHTHSQLSFDVSLAIQHHGDGGSLLSPAEAQQLLFGTDEKRFTRMVPALLLLATPQCEEALARSSFLPVGSVVDTAPYPQPSLAWDDGAEDPALNASSPGSSSGDQFLGSLTRFVSSVLSPPGLLPLASELHHWLDGKTMEMLPHQLLNLSDEVALEQLVQSEEPVVLLFPPNSQALLEQEFGHWRLESSLLQLLLKKLQAVIQELREIPAFQANVGLFQHLLAFCYYPLGPGSSDAAELPLGHRKLRTLLLLKALQTVRTHWQEKGKVSRQNRSARPQAYCRLQEQMVDFHYENFLIVPERYAANNCEGPCKLPLSTRVANHSTHAVLLLGMQERGVSLRRSPCCVPVKYSSKDFIVVAPGGITVTSFPNVVAEECGCR